MKRLLYIFIGLLVGLAVNSCSSSRGSAVTHGGQAAGDVKDLARVLAEKGDWQVVKIPANLSLSKPVSARIGGNITMVRDSEIRLSLRVFGIEVASASITDDSVKAYVKVQKVYLSESIPELLGGFPATVGNLQSLLLARIFEVGASTPNLDKCFFESIPDGYTVVPPRITGGMDYVFMARADGNLLTGLNLVKSGRSLASVTYAYPRGTSDRIPDDVTILGTMKGKSFEASIDYSVDRIDMSSSAPKTFEIPRGYRRISASSLLKLLDSLK